MTSVTALSNATKRDLEALPEHLKGELIDGVLYAMTRARPRHQYLTGRITSRLVGPYGDGVGGPGGWWILPEPGIELPRAPEISPDVAGWSRVRLPRLPDGPITLAPDWACEILSPTTRRHDIRVKKPFWAEAGLPWLWFADLDAQVLTALRNDDGRWVEVGVFADEPDARVPPFDEAPLDLARWWAELSP